MKKINNNGFVLAETLIVTVFLMVIFSMIYSNFYPIIGEYEKRETYDDVDAKYSVYWIKKLIEDESYHPSSLSYYFDTNHYIRFQCSNMVDYTKIEMCKKLVNSLEVSCHDTTGDNCDIFITNYTIKDFKEKVKARPTLLDGKNIFDSGLEEYIASLPDYINNPNTIKYRVIASFHHTKDNNNYYSYSTIEVDRS